MFNEVFIQNEKEGWQLAQKQLQNSILLIYLLIAKPFLYWNCHICYFESKDVPTQMTKQSFTIIYFITFKKTIHFKIICRNVHS